MKNLTAEQNTTEPKTNFKEIYRKHDSQLKSRKQSIFMGLLLVFLFRSIFIWRNIQIRWFE